MAPVILQGFFIFNLYHCKMELTFKQRWVEVWQQQAFRNRFLLGFVVLLLLLPTLPLFFGHIEKREGYRFNDVVLAHLPSINLSIPIFAIIWTMAVYTVWRCVQQPRIFLLFQWAFILLNVCRIISISLTPLNAPIGLIELKDPISNTFYGSRFITKDLFFSGHTATQFMMFLCLPSKTDKVLTFLSSLAIAAMVLVQHVHYTLDVVMAFVFAFPIVWLAKKIAAV